MEDRRLAAIMFTDIVGYTALMGENEPKALQLLERNRKIQKPLIEMYHGRFLKEMGDGMLASFTSVSDAVHCAQQILKISKEEPDLKLHIGIHLGEVIFSDGDVFGDGVNIASRIESSAKEGEICISEDVWKNIRNKEDLPVEFIGKKTFKNVKDPVGLYRIKLETAGVKGQTAPSAARSLSAKQIGFIATLAALFIIAFFVVIEYVLKERTGAALDVEKSIAVRPFWNESPDMENEYFVNGMVEDIRVNLAKISDLRVISRGSMEKYKETVLSTSEIAQELNVSYILEGTIQKIGNRLKIHTQLILAAEDDHVWEEVFEREITEVSQLLTIQSEFAQKIAKELKAVVTADEKIRLESMPTNNLDAYDMYVKGRYYLNEHTDFMSGVECFKKAIDFDPEFALAYVGLAQCYQFLGRYSYMPRDEGAALSKEAVLKALELDPLLAEAHSTLGLIMAIFNWNIYASEKEFQKAISLNPGNHEVYLAYAQYLRWTCRYEESIANIKKALVLDPMGEMTNQWLGVLYTYSGRYDESIDQMNIVLRINPDFVHAPLLQALNYASTGMDDMAIAYADTAMSLPSTQANTMFQIYCGLSYAKAGRPGLARTLLEKILEPAYKAEVDPIFMVFLFVALGEIDEAFDWLSRGVDQRSGQCIYLRSYADFVFKDIADDPRYGELLARVGFKGY